MAQSMIQLPDMECEKQLYKMEINDGKIVIQESVDEYGDDIITHDHPSLFFLTIQNHDDRRWPLSDFFKKLESADAYEAFVECCAVDLEDLKVVQAIVMDFIVRNKSHGLETVMDTIRMDPELRKHRKMFIDNVDNTKKCNDKINTARKKILKGSNIGDYLIDIFRDSDSFDEISKKILGSELVVRMDIQEEEFWDADRHIVKEFIREYKI